MASIPAPNRPVRLGLIGAGRWGRTIIRTLRAGVDGACLAAVASANPETRDVVPEGCRLFPRWQDLLAAKAVDGIIIATPPASHAEIAEAALAAGLPVLVEKPLTLDSASARRLLETAEAADALVRVGHIHLSAPAWMELKRRSAGLGPIRSITATAGNHGPYRGDVDVLWDWGPHDVALCLDLLGAAPDRIEARHSGRTPVAGGTAERLALSLGFGPVTAAITLGTDMDKTRRFQVTCQGGTLVYDDLAPAKLTLDGRPVPIAADLPLTVQSRDFAAAIRSGSRDRSGLRLGVAVVEVLERCHSVLAGPESLC